MKQELIKAAMSELGKRSWLARKKKAGGKKAAAKMMKRIRRGKPLATYPQKPV